MMKSSWERKYMSKLSLIVIDLWNDQSIGQFNACYANLLIGDFEEWNWLKSKRKLSYTYYYHQRVRVLIKIGPRRYDVSTHERVIDEEKTFKSERTIKENDIDMYHPSRRDTRIILVKAIDYKRDLCFKCQNAPPSFLVSCLMCQLPVRVCLHRICMTW